MDSANEKISDGQIDCYFCGEPCTGIKYKDWTELTHEGQIIALHPLCNPNVLPDGRLRCAVCKTRLGLVQKSASHKEEFMSSMLETGEHVGIIKLRQGQRVTIVTVADADGEMWQEYTVEHTHDEHSTGHIVVSVPDGFTMAAMEENPEGKWLADRSEFCLSTDENS